MDVSRDKYNRLGLVAALPRKILSLHGHENICEFVLHELCHERCFNLKKAAYFIDNPDFDCIKGVAGHAAEQAYRPKQDVWSEVDEFTHHMKQAPFNNLVRTFYTPSLARKGCKNDEILEAVGKAIGFENPSCHVWSMKHDNHGIFLYEKDETSCPETEYMDECICVLGFCPVF